jgi:hypothetical protein
VITLGTAVAGAARGVTTAVAHSVPAAIAPQILSVVESEGAGGGGTDGWLQLFDDPLCEDEFFDPGSPNIL